ncbi:MAG: hypothetical protein MZV64_71440 [Ignavibacteriales bacterium]|nr:hypothetical protein [Ignavibacteriales bacterium]
MTAVVHEHVPHALPDWQLHRFSHRARRGIYPLSWLAVLVIASRRYPRYY